MDIDGDGIDDIAGGSYNGEMIYYKGTKDGIGERIIIKQLTDIKDRSDVTEWLYTNPLFGDYNNDGLLDAFVSGFKGVRVMVNIGTRTEPYLGNRTPILDKAGKQVAPFDFTTEELVTFKKRGYKEKYPDIKCYVLPVDWDGDGIEDILIASSYNERASAAISFHRGVKTKDGHTYEERVPLFESLDGEKSIPGGKFIPYVADVNNDGVLDLIIGTSVYYNTEDKIIASEYADFFRKYPKRGSGIRTKPHLIIMYGDGTYK